MNIGRGALLELRPPPYPTEWSHSRIQKMVELMVDRVADQRGEIPFFEIGLRIQVEGFRVRVKDSG
jgi:hypothetical protein